MKTKTITIILTILIIVVPIAIMPSITNYYNPPKLVLLLLGGTLLLIFFLANYKEIEIDKKDILIIIFALLVFSSTMLSSDIIISIFGSSKRYEGMLTIFTYILIYLCAKKFLYYKNKNTLLKVLYIVYITICALGVFQYYIQLPNNKLYPIFNKGVCGTFGNTNFMGSFVSLGVPVFTMIYILKNKKLSLFTSIIAFFCMVACGARSSWVAFIVFIFLFFIYLIRNKNIKYFKRAFILMVCFILTFTYLIMPKNIFSKSESKSTVSFVKRKIEITKSDIKEAKTSGLENKMGSGRIQIWKVTIDLIKKYPIFGVGTDNLLYGTLRNPTEESRDYEQKTKTVIDKAHNEYLQIAVTEGIPALIIYLFFIFLIFKNNIKEFRNNDIKIIIFLAIISYLVQAFFNISTIGIAPLFWFALGLIDNKNI